MTVIIECISWLINVTCMKELANSCIPYIARNGSKRVDSG